jgi:hypothetical protein
MEPQVAQTNPSITQIVVTAEMDISTGATTLKNVTFNGQAGTTKPSPSSPTVLLEVDIIADSGGGGGVCVTSGGVTVCR